jgi:ribosome maturation factor RimP
MTLEKVVENKIVQILQPLIEDMGYEFWGLEYLAQGKHSLLRIFIDKSGGIGIEDCQNVSHAVSAMLDVEDPISGHYDLEVSSPGIPRPIFYNWQYQRYVGEDVQIKLYQPVAGRRKYVGTIISANEEELILQTGETEQHFPLSNIVKANLIDA